MTKKLGPLPVWAWGLILGVVGYYMYERYQANSSSSTTSATDAVLDPNSIDPNTGLTYGEEEDAALNADASSLGTDTTGGATTESGAQDQVGSDLTNFLDDLQVFGQVATSLGYTPPGTAGASATSSTPSTNVSPTTTNAANSAPVTTSSPPTITAAANTAPIQAQTAQSNQSVAVLGQIQSLLSSGFKKVSGTTQAGGLPETGTYTYTAPKGASLHTGPTKYFVYGTSATGYQIRAAS